MIGKILFYLAAGFLIKDVVSKMYSEKTWQYWVLYLSPMVYFYHILFK